MLSRGLGVLGTEISTAGWTVGVCHVFGGGIGNRFPETGDLDGYG